MFFCVKLCREQWKRDKWNWLKKTKSGNCLRLAVLIPLLRYNSCISRKKAAIRVYEKLEITKVAQKDISDIKMISYF